MAARNGTDSYGWVTRTLHWSMAAAVIFMIGLGTWIAAMQPSLSTLWLYALHKSVGLTLLTLVLVRLVWHRLSPPPPTLGGVARWQSMAALWTHRSLYGLLVAVPLTGWIASAATGIDVVFWGIVLPRIAPVSPALEDGFFYAHWILTRLLILAVALHIAGALHRQVIKRDATLRRMIGRGAG